MQVEVIDQHLGGFPSVNAKDVTKAQVVYGGVLKGYTIIFLSFASGADRSYHLVLFLYILRYGRSDFLAS